MNKHCSIWFLEETVTGVYSLSRKKHAQDRGNGFFSSLFQHNESSEADWREGRRSLLTSQALYTTGDFNNALCSTRGQ